METLSQKLSLNGLCFPTVLSELNPYSRQAKDEIRGIDRKGREEDLAGTNRKGSVEEHEESHQEEGSFSFLEYIRVFSYL